ncbi:MAG: hypothetical protein JNK29_12310 [Anaerolineales bacterium]|nr:hypothetical protein [Anaerolineales bacterium]
MKSVSLSAQNVAAQSVALRLVVLPGEVYRLPEAGQRLRVAAGQAWLSLQGRDLVLTAQESTRLPVSAEAALISAVGPAPITVELLN